MKIITTTTLTISPENEALIGIVAKNLGYLDWLKTTEEINATQETKKPTDVISFVKEYKVEAANNTERNLIIPAIMKYFGEAMAGQRDAVLSQLDEAITTNVTIE